MGRVENVRRSIVWGLVTRVIMIFFPFLTRTILIYRLGVDYVGLDSLFTSVLSFLNFSELGIGNAIVFSMYKPIAEKDDAKVCALLNLYKKCYRVIGCIVTVAGLCLLPFLDYLVAGEPPEGISLQYLYLIYLANTVLGYFLFAYKSSLFTAMQEMDVNYKIQLTTKLGSGILQCVVLIVANNYYYFIAILPLSTVVNNLFYGYISKKRHPQYKCSGKVDNTEIKTIEKNVGGMVFQKIGGIVLTSVDSLVISAFLGLTALGIYNSYYYIITAVTGFYGTMTGALSPSIGNSLVARSLDDNYRDMRKFHFLIAWLLAWWAACLLCLMQPFMRIWIGESRILPDSMVVLFAIYFFLHHIGDISLLYREGAGIWWENRFVPLTAAGVNLFFNILLVQIIGLPGILISTIIALIIVYIPGGSRVVFTKLFKDKSKWYIYIRNVVKYFAKAVITSALTYLLCSLVELDGIAGLFVNFAICMIAPHFFLLLLSFMDEDFKAALAFALRVVPTRIFPSRYKKRILRFFKCEESR